MSESSSQEDEGAPEVGPDEQATSLEQVRRSSGWQAELEDLATAHAERVRELELDRWRLNERIEVLEDQNAELHARFLEQGRALQRDLLEAHSAVSELQRKRHDELQEAHRIEGERVDAARQEAASRLQNQEARSERLLGEVLQAKSDLVSQSRDQQQDLTRQQALLLQQVAQVRREATEELQAQREQTAVVMQQLLKAKDEAITLQQAHVAELLAERQRVSETARVHRTELIEQEAKAATRLAQVQSELGEEASALRRRVESLLERLAAAGQEVVLLQAALQSERDSSVAALAEATRKQQTLSQQVGAAQARVDELSSQLQQAGDAAHAESERQREEHARELADAEAVRRELERANSQAQLELARSAAVLEAQAEAAQVAMERSSAAHMLELEGQRADFERQLDELRVSQEQLATTNQRLAADLEQQVSLVASEEERTRLLREQWEQDVRTARLEAEELGRQHQLACDRVDQAHELRLSLEAQLSAVRAEARRAVEAATDEARRQEARAQEVELTIRREIEASQQSHARQAARALEQIEAHEAENTRLRLAVANHEREVQRYRQATIELEGKVDKAKDTLSFRLGYLLIHSPKSWQGMKRLPAELLDLRSEAKRRRSKRLSLEHATTPGHATAEALRLLHERDLESAVRHAEAVALSDHDRANVLTKLAKAVKTSQPLTASRIAGRAYELSPEPFRAKWLAFLQYECGEITNPAALVRQLPINLELKASEKARIRQIEGLARLQKQLPPVPERRACSHGPVPESTLYVAASSLPFHTSGYTLRTHSLVTAIAGSDWGITVALRPGYPADRGIDEVPGVQHHVVEGISYRHCPGPHVNRTGLDQYLDEAVESLIHLAQQVKPEVIHAASNHVNALPALIAARRLGVPFVYEVRGMWELTAATRNLDWEHSERFALERELETLVARNADHVLTLTNGLLEELVARGVDRARTSLAPNAVDTKRFAPRRKDPGMLLRFGLTGGSFTIVYVGSLLHYEGLDDLLRAVALLVNEGRELTVVIAGDGEAREPLRRLAQDLGIERRVKLVGRVDPAEVPAVWSVGDAAAFPRKPFTVCELVSPLKPLEPMAMGLPVVVSDVAALQEMVTDGVTGLVHQAADSASLAERLKALIDDRQLGPKLGQAAREAVLSERTWDIAAERVVDVYRTITRNPVIEIVPMPAGRSSMSNEDKALLDERLQRALEVGGVDAVRDLVERQVTGRSQRFRSFCLLKAASCCQRANAGADSIALTQGALECDQSPGTLRGAARLFYAEGEFQRAAAAVDQLEQTCGTLEGKDDELAREVRGRAELMAQLSQRTAAPTDSAVTPGKSVYFLHFSLPYTSVGYATRSHGLLAGIQHAGYDVRPYTRPGFPHDFKPELEGQTLPETDEIDGIRYGRLLEGGRRGSTESEYLLQSADAYERVLRAEKPEVVHAASNYVTALPALIAARRLGLPFIYEIRGFWEITRSSRDNEFENSVRYALMREFEGLVAREADCVYTLTSAMKEELVRRGVEANKITLVHNGVDAGRFVPLEPRRELAERLGLPEGVPVIGYVGSFVDYEGLDDLMRAAGSLKRRGIDYRLLMVGDGAVMDELRSLVQAEGIEDRVVLTGRVPHEEVEAYYSLVDICPFPRKPWEVCEMVSPLKPFEAMAMQKVVVVSSTHALCEIVADGETGLVFEKGNVDSLADALQRLTQDTELRQRLAEQGRAWTLRERTWRSAGQVVVEGYRRVAVTFRTRGLASA